jgi:hypothetical protein
MLGFNKKSKKNTVAANGNAATTGNSVTTGNSTMITLMNGDKPVIWNLKEEPQKTISTQENSEEFRNQAHYVIHRNLADHVAAHPQELDYFVFDLKHDFLVDGAPVAHLALDEKEAWDLSVALVHEMATRKDINDPHKNIIVVINDAQSLLTNKTPENMDTYKQFLGNMQIIIEEGQSYGIHLLTM